MRIAKGIFLSLVFAFIAFVVYQNLDTTEELVSPIPHSDGVKVIRLTPTK